MNKFYAYSIDKKKGITTSWDDCLNMVKGKKAKYKKFSTKEEAEYWLENNFSTMPLESGIYFDAGTGHGNGTEVRVTNSLKENLLIENKIIDINENGNVHLRDKTNNYGELFGMLLALQLSKKLGNKNIFGDSKLVLDYWSKGMINRDVNRDTIDLALRVKILRVEFERDGGVIKHISGDKNPADLGFHK